MNHQKIEDLVSHIDYIMSELKHLRTKMTLDDGIHFNVILEDNVFIIELWDTDLLEPRILAYTNGSVEKAQTIREAQSALNQLGIRAFKKQIYWNSDLPWEDLTENFQKLDQVYKIEKRVLDIGLRQDIKERVNALYSLS
jgi:hypothetical protein